MEIRNLRQRQASLMATLQARQREYEDSVSVDVRSFVAEMCSGGLTAPLFGCS